MEGAADEATRNYALRKIVRGRVSFEDLLAGLLAYHSAAHAACAAENSLAKSVVRVRVVGLDREGEHRNNEGGHYATVFETVRP